MMKKYLVAMLGALSALFYALVQSKNRKIDKLKQENQSHKEKIKEQEFINNEKDKTQVNQADASNMSDDDIRRMYERNEWLDKD